MLAGNRDCFCLFGQFVLYKLFMSEYLSCRGHKHLGKEDAGSNF